VFDPKHSKQYTCRGGREALSFRQFTAAVKSFKGLSAFLESLAAPSFNGRTVGSEPINRGSNPWGATKNLYARPRRAFFFALFHTFSDFRDQYN
jgi:hypothetical protein